MSQYIFATYGVFGAMGPGLFGFGVSLAIEREQGLLTLKQALPQPPGAYLLARAVMAMLFVAIISMLLTLMAVLFGDVPLTFSQGAAACSSIDVLGALPFCAIGMCLGAMVSGAGFARHREPDLPAHGLPVGAVAAAAVHAASSSSTSRRSGPPTTWRRWRSIPSARQARAPSRGHIAVLAATTLGFFLLAMRRMHGGGFRLLGARPKRTLAIVAGAAALVLVLSLMGVFGGKPASKEEATAATDAASAATDTPAPEAPAGVRGARYRGDRQLRRWIGGSGIRRRLERGRRRHARRNSKATQRLVEGGAAGSKGALEVTGEIGNAIQYPFAGTMFFPQGPPMQGMMDYLRARRR